MVFFQCEACGSTLKKNQVDNHIFSSKNHVNFSCIDCNAVFDSESYRKHTSCITEEQKYFGKDHVQKENKGEVKQQAWFEQVQEAIKSINPRDGNLRALLDQISQFPNTPRKESKFKNFVKNSLRVSNPKMIDQAWSAISNAAAAQKQQDSASTANQNTADDTDTSSLAGQNSATTAANGNAEKPTENGMGNKSRNKQKRKLDEETEIVAKKARENSEECEATDQNQSASDRFSWGTIIVQILNQQPNGELKLKRLRKRVVAEFLSQGGHPALRTKEDIQAKFNKKLGKNKLVFVDGDRVRLKADSAGNV